MPADGDAPIGSMFVYGIAYAVASIGCTIGLFLATLLGSTRSDGVLSGVANVVAYGAGMALVVTALTITLAVANTGLLRVLRTGMRHVETIAAVFVVLSGLYLVYYFWVVDVNEDAAPITNQVEDLQNWILVRLSDNWQTLPFVLGAIVAAAIVYVVVRHDDGDDGPTVRASGDARDRATVAAVSEALDAHAVPLSPAATVMLVRDGAGGLEVFMLRRALGASFAGGVYVFPGGRVDAADHAAELEAICDDLDDAQASAQLGVDRGGLAYWVAAIRECFEEAGVLLARPVDSDDAIRFDDPSTEQRFDAARRAVHSGDRLARRPVRRRRIAVDHRAGSVRVPLDHTDRRAEAVRHPVLPGAGPGRAGASARRLGDDRQPVGHPSRRARPVAPPASCSCTHPRSATSSSSTSTRPPSWPSPPVRRSGRLPRSCPACGIGDDGRFLGVALPDDDDYGSIPVPTTVMRGRN